jgi:hypothetical protein
MNITKKMVLLFLILFIVFIMFSSLLELKKGVIKEGLNGDPTVATEASVDAASSQPVKHKKVYEQINWKASYYNRYVKQIEIKMMAPPTKEGVTDAPGTITSDIKFKKIRLYEQDKDNHISIGPTIDSAKLKYVTYSSNTNATSQGNSKIFEKWSNDDGDTSIPITKINGVIIDLNPKIYFHKLHIVMSTTSILNSAVIILKDSSLNELCTIQWHSDNNDKEVIYYK